MPAADEFAEPISVPSWLRWPPNCCETCKSWRHTSGFVGQCENAASTHVGSETDARFRCQDFYRKAT